MIPQPRGRPRDGCTWDMRTGQWMPTEGFTGIAPPAKKAKTFQVRVAQPTSHVLLERQHQLFMMEQLRRQDAEAQKKWEKEDAVRRQEEAENLRRNLEESRRLQELHKAKLAAEEAARTAEIRRIANLPENRAKRMFPTKPPYFVYYYDTTTNSTKELYATPDISSHVHKTTNIVESVYDELRDTIWPELATLDKERKAVLSSLATIDKHLQTTRFVNHYQDRKETQRLHLSTIENKISHLGTRQKELLHISWQTRRSV